MLVCLPFIWGCGKLSCPSVVSVPLPLPLPNPSLLWGLGRLLFWLGGPSPLLIQFAKSLCNNTTFMGIIKPSLIRLHLFYKLTLLYIYLVKNGMTKKIVSNRKLWCIHYQILVLLIVFKVLLSTCKLQRNHHNRS